MKLKIVEKPDSLESIILGIQSDIKRKAFHEMLVALSDDFEVTIGNSNDDYLPKIYLDDNIIFDGYYPSIQEMCVALGISKDRYNHIEESSKLFYEANHTRIGLCCGVGQNVYCDPYEDEEYI